MSKGLELTKRIQVVAGIDFDKSAAETHHVNFPNALSICADLKDLPPNELDTRLRHAGLIDARNRVDIVVGGPPCQAFSVAGRTSNIAKCKCEPKCETKCKHSGADLGDDPNDPRKSMFVHFVAYLRHFRPRAFIFENVTGIMSSRMRCGKLAIDVITGALKACGYNIAIDTLNASHYGVPQMRRRVIVIGTRVDLFIEPSHPPPTTKEAPPPVSTVIINRDDLQTVVPNETLYLSEKAITGMNTRRDRARDDKKGFGFQVLDMNRPSYTIPARYWKDGYDALIKYEDDAYRRLSVPELAAIQTFPPDFRFECSRMNTIKQIGNAVPCELARAIGQHVVSLLDEASPIGVTDVVSEIAKSVCERAFELIDEGVSRERAIETSISEILALPNRETPCRPQVGS